MKLIKTEKTLYLAASKAGMDEKTARKYINSKKLPSQQKIEHTWKTRKDPFEDVWHEVRSHLEANPGLEVAPFFPVFKENIHGNSLMVNCEHFRDEVAKYIKSNPSWEKQVVPTNYYQVKEELESLFANGEKEKSREYITKDEFNEIAKKHDVKNREELLKDLHFLGVSLWYKEMEEFNTLVLNPEWISDGVYKIINWVNEKKKYSLNLKDFAKVFKGDGNRFPEEKHEFLFKLMKHYELAYETENGELIIPNLLKEDRPEELPDFPVAESLMLRYKVEQPLPPNTVSRFIVLHNQEIKKELFSLALWCCIRRWQRQYCIGTGNRSHHKRFS